jgi:hypothetical protein
MSVVATVAVMTAAGVSGCGAGSAPPVATDVAANAPVAQVTGQAPASTTQATTTPTAPPTATTTEQASPTATGSRTTPVSPGSHDGSGGGQPSKDAIPKPPKIDKALLAKMQGTAPTPAQATAIHAVFNRVVDALRGGDWKALCSLYAPSVAKSLQQSTGKSCADAFQATAATLKQKQFAVVNLRVRGDTASGHDPHGAGGNGVTFQRVDGKWLMTGYP